MDETWTRHLKIQTEDLMVTPVIKVYNTEWETVIVQDVERMKAQANLHEVLSTYAHIHPCDGYIQGMNFVANILIYKLSAGGAFWGMTRFMAHFRTHMPFFDKKAFIEYGNKWNEMFATFSDGLPADEEYMMALKWGIYAMSCERIDIETTAAIWDELVKLPNGKWAQFTAALAAAACVRQMKYADTPYDARMMCSSIQLHNVDQLIRRAHRMVRHMDGLE